MHFHVLITQKSLFISYSFNTSNIHRYKHRNMKLNIPDYPWDIRGTSTTRASTATATVSPKGKRITHFKWLLTYKSQFQSINQKIAKTNNGTLK